MNMLVAITTKETYCKWCMIKKSTIERVRELGDMDSHAYCVGEHGHEWIDCEWN